MNEILITSLEKIVGTGQVLRGSAVEARFFYDWTGSLPTPPEIVVRPKTTEDVASIMAACNKHDQRIVVQGGMTGMAQSAIAQSGELVISLERLTKIEELDDIGRTITVGAGVVLQTIQDLASEAGLSFPLDLGARGSCTVGGFASTNAGGNRVVRYGMARDMILGLEVVLADGRVMTSLNRMVKNNAGYDLKHLFIGSEGTLGIITRAVLRLRAAPRSQNVAIVALPDFASVTSMLRHADEVLAGQLSAFEVMWQDFYKYVTAIDDVANPLPSEYPIYALIEMQGGDIAGDKGRFENMLSEALEKKLIVDAVIAQSNKEISALWGVRDGIGEALVQMKPFVPFDISLPTAMIEGFVQEARSALDLRWPTEEKLFFGHIGDNNLHIAVSVPTKAEAVAVDREIYHRLKSYGGSITAEHGVGMLKRDYLSVCRSPVEIAMMGQFKRLLDPKGLLNRGRIFRFE